MKKILLTLTLCSIMSTAVFASYDVKGTKYYFNSDTHMIEYENEKGKMVEYGPCTMVERVGNAIIAANNVEERLYGLMDMDLNEITPRIYDKILYDEETDTYSCYNREEDTITYFDGDFNEISEPSELIPIKGTDYYMLTEANGINRNKWRYYICDEEGNRLIDEGFKYLDSKGGTIIAMSSDREFCVFNSELETVIPYGEYKYIIYDDGKIRCSNDNVDHSKDVMYSLTNIKPINTDKELKPLFDDLYYMKSDDGLYYICDAEGNILKDKGYCEIDDIEGRIIVRSSDKYPRLYGMLDENLEEVFDEKYFLVSYNKEKGIYNAYLNGSIEKYDKDKNLIETLEGYTYLTPVKGMNGIFIYNTLPANKGAEISVSVIDDKGNMLTKHKYVSIDPQVQPGNTLIAKGSKGETVLNSNMQNIMPEQYGNMYVKEEKGVVYIENIWKGNPTKYFDLDGNEYSTKEEAMKIAVSDTENIDSSAWAKDTIEKAIAIGIVPDEIQAEYTRNITRQEFCKLAVMTYMAKTGNTVKENAESPFTDISDNYVTAAYELKIAAGKGNGKFAPNDSITRQEAAVMLNNLARLIGIEGSNSITGFADEKSFADWARDSIYSVSAAEIMTGTGNNNFSPLSNYTREQAITTVYRLYEQ